MVNVNKLFPRLSIRAKLVVAFSLFGVVPVGVVGGYGAVHSFLLLSRAVEDRLRAGVTMKAEELQRFLDHIKGDVLFLSRLPALQAVVALLPSLGPGRHLRQCGRVVTHVPVRRLRRPRSLAALAEVAALIERDLA